MKAVIIAGGKGARMGTMTDGVPKPMLKVGGQPVLERQIKTLKANGICHIIILAGYLGDVIESHFGDGSAFGVSIECIRETSPMGTSGCFGALRDMMREDCLTIYGDLIFDMDLRALIAFHKKSAAAATIVIHPNDHPHDSDLVQIDEVSMIRGFVTGKERETECGNLVNAAVYVLSPAVFKHIPSCMPSDFVKDIFPSMLHAGERLSGYRTTEYIKDMGTPERLKEAEADLLTGMTERLSKRTARPAVFLDRDGTIIRHIDYLSCAGDMEMLPFTAQAIRKINRAGHLAIMATNQPVIARNLCTITELGRIHDRLEMLLGTGGAYLDAIYFCPHHPDRGFPGENAAYKIPCKCRKPGTGMIRAAGRDFNIDFNNSWFVGDTLTDIEAGKRAGLRTALVKTGRWVSSAGKRGGADFIFKNLGDAVDFILDGARL